MTPRPVIYAVLCILALCYLVGANAKGYVPFASPTTRAAQGGTANHFHK